MAVPSDSQNKTPNIHARRPNIRHKANAPSPTDMRKVTTARQQTEKKTNEKFQPMLRHGRTTLLTLLLLPIGLSAGDAPPATFKPNSTHFSSRNSARKQSLSTVNQVQAISRKMASNHENRNKGIGKSATHSKRAHEDAKRNSEDRDEDASKQSKRSKQSDAKPMDTEVSKKTSNPPAAPKSSTQKNTSEAAKASKDFGCSGIPPRPLLGIESGLPSLVGGLGCSH